MYGHDRHFATTENFNPEVESNEQMDRQKIMRESQGWRCLMLISYILSGVEYYKTKKGETLTFDEFK